MKALVIPASVVALIAFSASASAQYPPGEKPALDPNRITQKDIETGAVTFDEIRKGGLIIFSTPFNKLDGYGDGPLDPWNPDKTSPGNRPTLQNNGTSLRVNGMDSQACLECHSILNNALIPSSFAVGGVGGIAASAMPGSTEIDVDDSENNGYVFYNGRYINPPFVWGAGGVELVAKEMTMQLQELKKKAVEHPYEWIPLVAHEVSFGYILWDKEAMEFDTTKVEGVEPDLVVRPFGRKGNNATIRKFDTGALMFHQGMFPVEIVGHKDNDGDGVIDEILEGDLSVLHIFSVALEKPYALPITTTQIDWGFKLFKDIGCATCHVPTIDTFGRVVPVSLPEDETNPWKDVFYQVDISKPPASFPIVGHGVRVDMFSDLKRHYMGKELAESTGDPLDPFFITPRLWGVADTAPYLHDSRALTLTDAIVLHGGEAAPASQKFQDLADADKIALLTFLRTLKVPKNPNSDLMDDAGGLP